MLVPPEHLIDEWLTGPRDSIANVADAFSKAAQWGADQELQACCEWAKGHWLDADLRAARRPPSLKQKALAILDQPGWSTEEEEIVRKALNTIPD